MANVLGKDMGSGTYFIGSSWIIRLKKMYSGYSVPEVDSWRLLEQDRDMGLRKSVWRAKYKFLKKTEWSATLLWKFQEIKNI